MDKKVLFKFSGIGAILGLIIGWPTFNFVLNFISEKKIQACALKQGYVGMCGFGFGIRDGVISIILTIILMVILSIIGWIIGEVKSK